MPIIVNTDGGSRARHSKGHSTGAAWAFVVQHPTHGKSFFTGLMDDPENASNNESEYQAMIEALNWLNKQPFVGQVVIRTDSELISRQLSGRYAVSSEVLLPYWMLALAALEELKLKAASVAIEEIKREYNKEADALCNQTMDNYEASLRKQP